MTELGHHALQYNPHHIFIGDAALNGLSLVENQLGETAPANPRCRNKRRFFNLQIAVGKEILNLPQERR
jgi:hypothetical protein